MVGWASIPNSLIVRSHIPHVGSPGGEAAWGMVRSLENCVLYRDVFCYYSLAFVKFILMMSAINPLNDVVILALV